MIEIDIPESKRQELKEYFEKPLPEGVEDKFFLVTKFLDDYTKIEIQRIHISARK